MPCSASCTSTRTSSVTFSSLAILTSERARIGDPRVRALADKIITSQREEIDQIKALIEDLKGRR